MRLPIKLSPDKCILTVQIRFNEIVCNYLCIFNNGLLILYK